MQIETAWAQSYELRISKITDEKGEDPGATFSIVEDSVGFIWFGTVDGLYRYDGFNYKVYRNQKNNPNSLAWNTIRAMCMGKDNKLWIGTQGAGLDCFDLTHETFHHYPCRESQSGGITGSDIWALTMDRTGNIWVGVVGNGVDMLDCVTNKFTHYNILPESAMVNDKITIRALHEDREGIIWVGTDKYGLSALDPKTGKVKNYQHEPANNYSLLSNEIRDIFEDEKGHLWVLCYTGGLDRFDRNTETFIPYQKKKSDTNSLVSNLVCAGLENRPNELWIGTEYGLTIWDMDESVFSTYQHEQTVQNNLGDNRIRVIFKDRKGIVWVGSEAGVDEIVKQNNFKIFINKLGTQNTLPQGIVRSILEDDEQNLWIGIIDMGLVKYNPRTKKFTRFIHHSDEPMSISGNRITSILQDSQGNLWFGEWSTGLNKLNKKNGTFELVAGNKPGIAKLFDTRIQFIKEAKPGVLWIGTENGINRLDTRTKTCTYILHDERNPNSISGNTVQSNAFIQDSSGNLWVGTWSNGLNRIEFSDSSQLDATYKRWKYDPDEPNGLNNNNVISLYLDSTEILWIGTFGGGLNRFDLKSGKFRQYTTDNGLPNNVIYGILEDNNHNLWLSTDRGLSKFDPKSETFKNYTKTDGLQDDHFFWGATYKSRKGELFFGGINGLSSFFPDQIKENNEEPIPVLTDFKVFEKSIKSNFPLWKISKLQLLYKQNYITIEYAALDFTDPDKNRYMIKMDGVDNDWHSNGNRRVATYSNLSPGNYTFHLKIANNDGIWNTHELQLNLFISPPWWKTRLAQSIFILLLVSSALGFYFMRVGILKNQTRKLEQLVILRTQEIQNQKEELQVINEDLSEQKEELYATVQKLKEAQNQLIESEKMASLGILTAGVAHEINNPLNFIQGGVVGIETILEENPEYSGNFNFHKEIEKLLDWIRTGVLRISEIVTSLNHFNRQNESHKQDCDIHVIMENCLLILNNQLKFRVEVVKNFMSDNLIIRGNEGKLHQLFLNLLSNSAQAIEGEGKIEISTTYSNGDIVISIKDNGCGISKDNLAKIFDPFFTTKESGKGTGLGLSIAYGIVKDHCGTMEFISEVGKGTEAVIRFPQNV